VSDSPGFDLDNPMLVRWEFASEERLATRNSVYRQLVEGVNAEDLVFEAVAERSPSSVLDVGCGAGELAERIENELSASVCAVDTSERMVALTRERGVDAQLADVQALPFEDGRFDCVVAGWVFYHVADRALAIRECARVLAPGGRLVAATTADENISELWTLLGRKEARHLSFSSTNGAEQLAAVFPHVEAREAEGVVVFRDTEAMRRLVAADITRAHLAANVPAKLDEPFRARSRHTVFVADKA
jgi:SAM-dependent methyltransferase